MVCMNKSLKCFVLKDRFECEHNVTFFFFLCSTFVDYAWSFNV